MFSQVPPVVPLRTPRGTLSVESAVTTHQLLPGNLTIKLANHKRLRLWKKGSAWCAAAQQQSLSSSVNSVQQG